MDGGMEKEKLSVLLVDDDPGDAELLYRQLEDIPGREIEFLPFTTYQEALETISTRDVDLIFIDYLLGAETGLQALKAIKATGTMRPVIMLTGQGNEKVAVEAMKAGAADYLVKRYTSTDDLHRALLNAMEKAALHQKIEEQRRELERFAMLDGLTGLFNRRFFIQKLISAMEHSKASNEPMSLLMMDLDFFKKVNDTHGHLAGDDVLIRSAEVIRTTIGSGDIAGRFGGEEFCIALLNKNLADAAAIAEKIRHNIHAVGYGAPDGTQFHVTVSIGAAQMDPKERELTPLIREADNALYRAKENGRNRVCQAGAA